MDMKSLASIFPRASKSFHDANPQSLLERSSQNDVQPIVDALRPKRGKMNSTESEFALILEAQKRAGEILRYEFQGITLRWGVDEKTGDSMRYTPDFVVMRDVNMTPDADNWLVFIEVKGPHIHYRQQAVARFKGCRACWPEFQFEMHQKTKQGWKQIL